MENNQEGEYLQYMATLSEEEFQAMIAELFSDGNQVNNDIFEVLYS